MDNPRKMWQPLINGCPGPEVFECKDNAVEWAESALALAELGGTIRAQVVEIDYRQPEFQRELRRLT